MEISAMRALVRELLESSLKRYHQDLEAIPEDKFTVSPGGAARSAADFTVECTALNIRFTKVLKREEPGAFSFDGWSKASGDAVNKSYSCAEFKRTADELLATFDALDDLALDGDVQGFRGPVKAYDLAHFAGVHINYHDGQLNILQAVFGDEEVHWV